MIRNTALIVPREGNIEFQNVPKASVFCLGDSFLPFLPPSFPLPIPLPALTTAVQRQCLDVQGRTRVYTVQRVTVQRVTGRRGQPHTGSRSRAYKGVHGPKGEGPKRHGAEGGEPHTGGQEEERGRRRRRRKEGGRSERSAHGPESKGSRKRTSLFCVVHFRGAPMHTSH